MLGERHCVSGHIDVWCAAHGIAGKACSGSALYACAALLHGRKLDAFARAMYQVGQVARHAA